MQPVQGSEALREFMRRKHGAASVLEMGGAPLPATPGIEAAQAAPAPLATTTGEVSSVGTGKSEAQVLVEALASRLKKLP